MRYSLSFGPAGVVAMTSAITDYCGRHNLDDDMDRQSVARRVMDIYTRGGRDTLSILAELKKQDGPEQLP